jgi:hypothetical protein
LTSVALGSVRSTLKPGQRGFASETFRALVEDERGRHWSTVAATVQQRGEDEPVRLIDCVVLRRDEG